MKTFLALGSLLLLLSGCKTPVEISGGYAIPGTNIAATVHLGTNAVSIGGTYQTGATNINGSVTIGK